MIALALSGGVDSTAAALVLHEQGERFFGLTLFLDDSNPSPEHIERARRVCRRLGVGHHMLDARDAFEAVKDLFCREYLAGRTPNPCVHCNKSIKFGLLLRHAMAMGADMLATGHYAALRTAGPRRYFAQASENVSQEYFLGLVGQEALKRSVFPLGGITKAEARALVARAGFDIPQHQSSKDACFVPPEGYAALIERRTGIVPKPGPIIDARGRVVGIHRGVMHYTIGQRRGLGISLGRPVYVLGVDPAANTVRVGPEEDWERDAFEVRDLNFMKIASMDATMHVRVKVRYRQDAVPSLVHPVGPSGCLVEYKGLYAPGQLAVFYDGEGSVLCAGIIEYPSQDRDPQRLVDQW